MKINIFTLFSLLSIAVLNSAMKVLPPENPNELYHGAFTSNGGDGDEVSLKNIQDFESLVGKKLAWVYFADNWYQGEIVFPEANIKEIKKTQAIPYIRMSPWSKTDEGKQDSIVSLQKIIDGKFDKALRDWARAARDCGTPMMIEFGPEVNGKWFPWNGIWNGGSTANAYGDPLWPDGPERFRDSYRHIVDLFRHEGALNITWVLHVDSAQDPEASWNDPKWYYPGDDYIDWIGVTVYGAQLPQNVWEEFTPKLALFWPRIEAMSKTKPVLISEYSVIEDANNPFRKSMWISSAMKTLMTHKYPRIRGATYWHSDGWLPDKRASFRVDSTPESLKGYKDAVSDPLWIYQIHFSQP